MYLPAVQDTLYISILLGIKIGSPRYEGYFLLECINIGEVCELGVCSFHLNNRMRLVNFMFNLLSIYLSILCVVHAQRPASQGFSNLTYAASISMQLTNDV